MRSLLPALLLGATLAFFRGRVFPCVLLQASLLPRRLPRAGSPATSLHAHRLPRRRRRLNCCFACEPPWCSEEAYMWTS